MNRPVSQIPRCIRQLSHNASLCSRNMHTWSPVDSPHKGQWRGALMFSLICAWTNAWADNREVGDLRRHRAHCNVTVIKQNKANKTVCKDVCNDLLKLNMIEGRMGIFWTINYLLPIKPLGISFGEILIKFQKEFCQLYTFPYVYMSSKCFMSKWSSSERMSYSVCNIKPQDGNTLC